MRHLPPLRSLQAFEAASRLNSFRKAADELCITPSAISHRIQDLEQVLGVTLFHRAHRTVHLTDAGKRYAASIGDAFGTIEAATRDASRTSKSDLLTIHSVPSFAAQWLMPRLAQFEELVSDIDVRLNASVDTVDLAAGEADFCIRYGPTLRQHGITTEAFPEESIVVLCSPDLMRGPYPIRRPSDLAHHTLIHSEVNLYPWRDWQRDHPGVALNLDRGARFDRSFMAISAAVDGRGVCLESRILVQRELEAGRLVMPLGPKGGRVSGHSLSYLSSKLRLPKMGLFREWLMERLREQAH
ncbi:MAG: transcriptional regulator GcvA [Pseudomonadota bacterium]